MKIFLKYFSGTGNSWKILDTCKGVFKEHNIETVISPLRIDEQPDLDAEIIGFCFPVYAFGIPRLCRRYLNKLTRFKEVKKAFVIITTGKYDEAGFSVKQCEKILQRKNCNVIYSAVVEMPINWTTFMNPPSDSEACQIIGNGVSQAREISNDILRGISKYHVFTIPQNYGRWGLYREYYLFKYFGIQNLWRSFKVYSGCNGCGVCEKICPTGSIKLANEKPVWSSSCEQCMRCVNFCPQEAIYQSMGGETAGRNRYRMPDFKPVK